MDAFKRLLQAVPRAIRTTGRSSFCILQAEDELAAIGMVIGASWAGARAFTPTAGPGISLMSEFIGLAYYAEIPAVIFDVQRTGPSTGMPTRTQQGDLMLCAYASHGDTKHICLYPGESAKSASSSRSQAFDLAERFQTPVFVLTDLDIGMNDWMCRELTWDDSYRPDRGKVLDAEELEKRRRSSTATSTRTATASPQRTLPGVHPKGAYFTRGSGHNKLGGYTEMPTSTRRCMDRIARKIAAARPGGAGARSSNAAPGATIGLVTVGGCDARRARGARRAARSRASPLDYMRVRGFPFGDEVETFLDAHEHVLRRRAEPRRAAARAADARDRRAARRSCTRCATTAASRSARDHVVDAVVEAAEGWRQPHDLIAKPQVQHPALQTERARADAARLRRRDVDAVRRLRPRLGHRRDRPGVLGARRSRRTASRSCRGIGCSSKTPPTSCAQAHGFNSVHGRMPAIATGANAANRDLDLHRHLGRRRLAVDRPRPAVPRHPPQREHALRAREQRRLRPDQGAVLGVGRRRLEAQEGRGQHMQPPIDPVLLALTLGATFVARSFSGDKAQLGADPQGRPRAQGLRVHRRDLAVRDASTITRARPRATRTRASTKSRWRTSTSCRCGRRSRRRTKSTAR